MNMSANDCGTTGMDMEPLKGMYNFVKNNNYYY